MVCVARGIESAGEEERGGRTGEEEREALSNNLETTYAESIVQTARHVIRKIKEAKEKSGERAGSGRRTDVRNERGKDLRYCG